MTQVVLILALLLSIIALAAPSQRVSTPPPVVLVAGGLALGLAARAANVGSPIEMPVNIVLVVVLPPLLASAAFEVPLRAFRANLPPITLLAIGLVLAQGARAPLLIALAR